jgi:hypothetical protein
MNIDNWSRWGLFIQDNKWMKNHLINLDFIGINLKI